MPKRKRTVSDAIHTLSPKKRKFNAPKIIDSTKWKQQHSPRKNINSIGIGGIGRHNGWRCIDCDRYNINAYVFCSNCGVEPPFIIRSPLKPINLNKNRKKEGFKHVEPLYDTTNNINTEYTNHNNHNIKQGYENNDILMKDMNHNHNIKQETSNKDPLMDGYPNYEIKFEYVSNDSARAYAHYLEKNIRREQTYHINKFNEYLNRLKEIHTNDYNEFTQQFGCNIQKINRDNESGDMIIKMKMKPNDNINKCYLGEFAIGTPILALCQCQFDEIHDIDHYFHRAIHGQIEETPKTMNDFQFKITVIKDRMNTLKEYKNKNRECKDNSVNTNTENDNILIPISLFNFSHTTLNCSWILCVNNLNYYATQLKHLDTFVNATKYQLPHKVFDYIYNCDISWMLDDENNDLYFGEYLSKLQEYNLNDSQQASIAKSLIYPISLIQGPPGTGKTYTLSYLCEFIINNKYKQDDEIIVITAHSHSACDQILECIIKIIDKNKIVRFGSINKIGKHLKKYSFKIMLKHNNEYDEYMKLKRNGLNDKAKEMLMKIARNILMDEIDIVITTCYGCSNTLLMNNDISISHLIIDEATQIVESELLIAMNLLRDKRNNWNNNNEKITNYYSPEIPHCDTLKPMVNGNNNWEQGIDLNDFKKRIVIIGDPKQLSPVVQSTDAIQNGFGISLFERLLGSHSVESIKDKVRCIQREKRKMERENTGVSNDNERKNDMFSVKFNAASKYNATELEENESKIRKMMDEKKEKQELYCQLKLERIDNDNNNSNNNYIMERENNLINYTLLNIQYRMKEFMMQFSNETFYDSNIQTYMKKEDEMKYVINGIDWNNNNKSLMFVSLESEYIKQIKTKSMSYYNEFECNYINDLISNVLLNNNNNNNNLCEIKGKDIGIIAMHKAQVSKMKYVLSTNNITKDIEVNTVDGFQGKEKKLIVLSFVRTDCTSTSFLANAQRCNVALTRAKYGLIVVGKLQQLKANRMWKKFAKFVETHKLVKVINND